MALIRIDQVIFSCIIASSSVLVAMLVTLVQPEPYMDEVFHVRQTLAYLHGNYTTWDAKITTPPGMYVLFSGLYKFLFGFRVMSSDPNTLHFRMLSALTCGLNFLLMSAVSERLSHKHSTLLCISLSTNPVLWFFSVLYYTDHCALFFVLLSLHASFSGCRHSSALFCGLGIFVRQTNVVWLPLGLAILMARDLRLLNESGSELSLTHWLRKLYRVILSQPSRFQMAVFKGLLSCWPHFFVLTLFVVFVYVNGGVVLGDKKAHVAVINVPQVWYFCVFCSVCTYLSFIKFLSGMVWHTRRKLIKAPVKFCYFFVLSFFLIFLIVASLRFTSFVHPYLLADNRHYMFYIWRRFINRSSTWYYSLSLLYSVCFIYWFQRLISGQSSLCLVAARAFVVVGSAASLIPIGLLEPRYFLVPYVLWRLLCNQSYDKLHFLCAELIFNILLSVIVVFLFVYKPFYWPQVPEIPQRFMW